MQHHPADSALVDAILREIHAAGGRLTFARYMELALYHPWYGYYLSGERIGKAGDFFTSVSVGPLFGRIWARQFLKCKAELGDPPDFEIVEFGGHRGQMRDDVLREAPALKYRIVEARDPMPARFTGCAFSNEFLDALPVHRVKVVRGEWQELYVAAAEQNAEHRTSNAEYRSEEERIRGRGLSVGAAPGHPAPFAAETGPLSTPRLAEALCGLPADLMEGYTTEVNLRALEWIEEVARRLLRGLVFTVDYGYERPDYFAPHRREGTLLCTYRHTRNADPFRHVGEQDITAHVEFSSLIEHGRRLGLEPILFTDQSRFLLEAGQDLVAEIAARDAGRLSPERNMIHQLAHPSLMGRTFKVLVQRKHDRSGEKPCMTGNSLRGS